MPVDYGRYLDTRMSYITKLATNKIRGALSGVTLASSLIFSQGAHADILDTSNALKSEINSVESIYDKNAALRTSASSILYETAVHESGLLKYSHQVGGGPAVSKFHIEPVTAKNLISWAQRRASAKNLLTTESGMEYKKLKRLTTMQLKDYLVHNEKFAVALARLKYASVPGRIPSTLVGRSSYWSKYYQGTSNPKKREQYISDNRKMAEELKASTVSRVLGKHVNIRRHHPNVGLKNHYNKTKHAIASYAKKLGGIRP